MYSLVPTSFSHRFYLGGIGKGETGPRIIFMIKIVFSDYKMNFLINSLEIFQRNVASLKQFIYTGKKETVHLRKESTYLDM